ncbi:MAG: membrane dipeptidase [Gammaproteobacteria bacterium]|jgi:membrane dipeptidase
MSDNSSFSAQALDLFDQTLVWDAHAGFETNPGMDLQRLAIWKNAGVGFLSINVGYDVWPWQRSMKSLAFARRWVLASDDFALALTAAQVRAANAAGRMAVAFDLEGMNALDGCVDMVGVYHALGVRQMLFAYNRNNLAGGGCHDDDSGLSSFGGAVIDEMNDLGMLIDCSHTGYRTTMDAMARSRAPVVFSHSNPRALWDHQRNILDEQARACAQGGGVVGINGISAFLGADDTRTETLANHIDYLLDLIGDQSVGIGLDFFFDADEDAGFNSTMASATEFWPADQYPQQKLRCAEPRQLLELTEELLRRNHAQATVKAVLGGNFMRVAAQVWG